jgi:lincosamide nucleotidyltransferase A/C/D/E
MVGPEDASNIYNRLANNGIRVWLTGGWGIDALLGRQTRPHKDLDVILLLEDVRWLRRLLERDGFHLKELWSENRWEIDSQGVEIATAFVLQGPEGRELDAHAMRLDEGDNGIPAWENEEGIIFTHQDLSGLGYISGQAVRCITPEKQMLLHTGYSLPEAQRGDLELLHERLGVAYPDGYPRPQLPGA